jgi:acetoin utilization protein AcuC
VGLAPRLVALGGGGYDLSNVARAWTAAWALMNGVTLPPALPPAFVHEAAPYLGGQRTLWDSPTVVPIEAVRPAREFAVRQVAELRRLVFPLLGVRAAGA